MSNNKYRQSKEYHLVYNELINAAQKRGTVTYQELAKLVGLPLSGNHMSREIGMILGTISEDEIEQNRPMLSAIAVNVKGEPGEGFYTLAHEHGLLQDTGNEAAKKFWEEQKRQVYQTWKRDLK